MSGPEELRALVERVRRYIRERRMIRGLDKEQIHGLHIGTDREVELRAADIVALLDAAESSLASPAGMEGWMPIETAPKDGAFVLLYWPTMSITQFPAVGFHHGDEYGWELAADRDYGEIIPTLWCQIPPLPAAPRGEAE